MDHLPIFLDIRGRKVLVDGGGTAAARRAERALDCGALVTVCDPAPGPDLSALAGHAALTLCPRPAEAGDLDGCAVAWGASGDAERDARLSGWCRTAGVLCNVADMPEQCDFITPSVVDRSPVVVAVSTGGTAPVIARILRARIEEIPAHLDWSNQGRNLPWKN